MTFGPTIAISEEIHTQKYRQEGETFEDAMERVAAGLADNSDHYDQFFDIIHDMRFMPAGRVQAAIGARKTVTPYNCFVSGTIEDSFVAGAGSIMERATQAAATMRMGGGIGYDFSTLRPEGDLIKKLASSSSGPISFMKIFDAVCKCVASSGHRRGAQMGVLRVDHPDIMKYIDVKTNSTELTGFNLSIAMTDKFMETVISGREAFDLTFGGRVYGQVNAQEIWEKVMRTTWEWAEPGVLFIDRINEMNNLYYCETIAATNPCGEQPLPPFGACLLGSFNLVKYIHRNRNYISALQHDTPYWIFDWTQFRLDIAPVVRAMDNVVDRAIYPLPEQEAEAKAKRRMGLGITGLANAAEALGFEYGSVSFLAFERQVLSILRDETYMASAFLANEKGAFPLYDHRYLEGKFVNTLPEHVQDIIRDLGIRNSHLTSIAPTGTISLSADNVSSSIEPVFSYGFDRYINLAKEGGGFEQRMEKVEDYGVRFLKTYGKTTDKVTAQEHVAVLNTAQSLVDSAVSKTCNVSPTMPWKEFKNIYVQAYQGGAKGCTTFNSGGKRFGVLVAPSNNGPSLEPDAEDIGEEGQACMIDPVSGRRSCE